MSLKTDYLQGATGLTTQMLAVFTSGEAFITNNLVTLTTEMQTAAAAGITKFTVSIVAPVSGHNLRLKGTYMNTYFAGIRSALMAEEIYDYEVSVVLNTSDTVDTSIDLNFNL
ncbi:hypothetical protein UFOVP53_28 [uncultured Caudovirales phage]|uniref:Uncharacterized protein n=1 Tax=uncultured Caudovirales phage TaxID=2100421 RepID=A0A6J5KXT4_9CAUD|nr:hypothetical protein UFOVP53_28 [uncultured Caudovirales phage]